MARGDRGCRPFHAIAEQEIRDLAAVGGGQSRSGRRQGQGDGSERLAQPGGRSMAPVGKARFEASDLFLIFVNALRLRLPGGGSAGSAEPDESWAQGSLEPHLRIEPGDLRRCLWGGGHWRDFPWSATSCGMHRARSENHWRLFTNRTLPCCASDIVGDRTGVKATRARLRISSSFGRRSGALPGRGTGCASKAAAPTVRIEMLSLQRTNVLDSQTGRC